MNDAHVSSRLKELLSGPRFAAFQRAVAAVQRLETTPLGPPAAASSAEVSGAAAMSGGSGVYGAFAGLDV